MLVNLILLSIFILLVELTILDFFGKSNIVLITSHRCSNKTLTQ